MYNYCNTLNHNLKRGILNFSEKISKNFSRLEFKFVSQMIFGILSSQSCMLSEIGRRLGETTTLKKIIDRLSRNLKEFNNAETLFENYLHSVKSQINNNTILIIDESDITKKYTTKSECITTVRDGSTGEYRLGYHTVGVMNKIWSVRFGTISQASRKKHRAGIKPLRIWRSLFHLQTDLIVCNNNINSLVLLQGCFFVILSYQVAKTVFYALPI